MGTETKQEPERPFVVARKPADPDIESAMDAYLRGDHGQIRDRAGTALPPDERFGPQLNPAQQALVDTKSDDVFSAARRTLDQIKAHWRGNPSRAPKSNG